MNIQNNNNNNIEENVSFNSNRNRSSRDIDREDIRVSPA